MVGWVVEWAGREEMMVDLMEVVGSKAGREAAGGTKGGVGAKVAMAVVTALVEEAGGKVEAWVVVGGEAGLG